MKTTITSHRYLLTILRLHGVLPTGTAFTVISNTSAKQIAGTFANLAGRSIFTASSNTYQVNYKGGDRNDLALTVVPWLRSANQQLNLNQTTQPES